MSLARSICTKDGGGKLIVVEGKGEGFDDSRMRAIHMEHVHREGLSVAEEMESEGTRIISWESSKVGVTMRIKLGNIADCNERFDLSLTNDGVTIDMAEDGRFIY